MASVAQDRTVKVTINGIDLDLPQGELIVEAVKRIGGEIPVFCYHPRLKPVGMCRMCLVEVGFKQQDGSVRMMPKPQAACTLPASEGMVVLTESEAVHKDRKGVLEFLLTNHPLDCPICDRGGECPLQNNTMAYGPSTSRFLEMKRHLPKAFPLSQYVTLDLERCIQCGRCVRFTEEISGDSQLAFRFRGADMQPSTFKLTDFESKFSGNVIEICPVGALTNAKYRFRARPWDLETGPALCTLTPCGTNIWLDHRAGKLVRINGRTNEEVNEEWTSDRTKFGHDFYNDPQRIKAPFVRKADAFERVGWGEASSTVANLLAEGSSVAALVSDSLSNETMAEAVRLFREVVGTKALDCRTTGDYMDSASRPDNRFGSARRIPLSHLEHQTGVLVFGTSLADEQPMTFLRVRKGWFQRGMKVVVAHDAPTDADSFAHVVLRHAPGAAFHAANALAIARGVDAAKGTKLADACARAGLNEADVKAAAQALQGTEVATVTTHSLTTTQGGIDAHTVLAGSAASLGQAYCYLGNACNSSGALELGIVPNDNATDTKRILEACASGQIKTLVLVGMDPIDEFPIRDLAERALEAVENLVCIAASPGSSAPYATVVLPLALPAEQDGTYTSSEFRVQRMKKVLAPPGEAKPGWKILAELAEHLAPGSMPYNVAEVSGRISQSVQAFSQVSFHDLPEAGLVLPQKETAFDPAALAKAWPSPK